MSTAVRAKSAAAVGYFRVSTMNQAGERHVSLETQEASFRSYCTINHLTPIATFTDVQSGRRDDRIEYQAMLRYVVEHDIGHVVVLFLDRFGRNPREILRRYWELEERGITVESANEDLKEELLLLVRAGIAGAESRRTSERVKAASFKAAAKGRHMSRPPYGYRQVKDGNATRWEQEPGEAEAVRLAYRLSVEENKGYMAIANDLNRLGYRGKPQFGSKPFSPATLVFIMKNPNLRGALAYGRTQKAGTQVEVITVEGVFPAILSMEEWERLQERLAIRSEHSKGRLHLSSFLLSGIARCGHCGGSLVGTSRMRGEKREAEYYCRNHKDATVKCPYNNGHAAHRIEAAVLDFLGQYDDPNRVRELLQVQDTQADTRQEQELARVTTRLKELEAGMLNDLDRLDREIITEGEYTKRAEVRRQEQGPLQARKGELEASIAAQRDREAQAKAVPVKVGSFLEDFQGMDVVKAKAILQTILKSAHVWKDGKIELEFR
ncbi:MAG: recombinase family protein [Chloroflexota bacterium]